ncbi:hypothetical protein BJY01DRAFT_226308 [Aspergillus pseudoustus]|uniref:Ankyrin repeat-containing domain protein n=1 Tax=Aspergillus pseudoustus TaxID=1810923 RepID=A0ABR4IVY4_9EURO
METLLVKTKAGSGYALVSAAANGHADIVNILIVNGACPGRRWGGKLPVEVATNDAIKDALMAL